jgi:hypothetical protein
MTNLWLPLKWVLWKLGLVESWLRPLDQEEDATIKPIYHDNPLFAAQAWRLSACEAKAGNNRWLTVFARGVQDEPLAGMDIHWDVEGNSGVVADRPRWMGTTDERGICRFRHPGRPARYELYVNGVLVLSNVRTDLNVDCYCHPYCDPKSGATWSWRKINKPGFYGYYVYLTSKERTRQRR